MGWIALLFFFVSVGFTMKTIVLASNIERVINGAANVQTGVWLCAISWTATAFFANWFNLITLS